MFAETIANVRILSILDLYWDRVDSTAAPRPYHALSFRVGGNAVFTSGGESIPSLTGEIMYVPEGMGYHLQAGEETLFCIHFLAEGVPTDRIWKFTPVNSAPFAKLFAHSYELWSHKSPGYSAAVLSDFYKILSHIQRQQAETRLSAAQTDIGEAVRYIHEHFTDPNLNVGQLAQVSMLSESHFRKVFREHFGVSPLEYIRRLRVDYATELIEAGYYKVYEIAAMSGFGDVKYFSTVLKRFTGKSPMEHKKSSI